MRGRDSIFNRFLTQAEGFDLGLLVRKEDGMSKPRGLGHSFATILGCRIVPAVLYGVRREELGAQEIAAA